MRIKNIYKIFGILVLFVALQSRSSGPGSTANLQVTGAPGSTGNNGTCANTGCHTSGSFGPSHSMELLDGNDAVTSYQPGKTYTLKVSIATSSGNPSEYGFQAVSLDGGNSQAGNWEALPVGIKEAPLSGRKYAEHSFPSSNSSFELDWVAPDQGTGNVTFYSAGIATNANANSTGDGTASSTLIISEEPINNVLAINKQVANLRVLPNPVNETLNLQINSLVTGDFNVRIMDVMGRVVANESTFVQAGEQKEKIAVSHLPAGMYVVQLCGEGHLAAVQMLKN